MAKVLLSKLETIRLDWQVMKEKKKATEKRNPKHRGGGKKGYIVTLPLTG